MGHILILAIDRGPGHIFMGNCLSSSGRSERPFYNSISTFIWNDSFDSYKLFCRISVLFMKNSNLKRCHKTWIQTTLIEEKMCAYTCSKKCVRCMYVCVCVCVYMYIYTQYMYIFTQYIFTQYIYTHIYIYIYVYTVYIHICIYMYIHICTLHLHIYVHTHIEIICIYIYIM